MTGRGSHAFAFWLDYLDSRGGLWERSGDAVLAILPEQLSTTHDLPESGLITDDPDISREDGVLFLGAGHPEIGKAAEAVIDAGDVGVLTVAHRTPAPSTEDLLARIRDQVPVDHGRIDATGAPIRSHRPTLRVGALVSHTVSAEEQFTEVVECLLDVPTEIPWPQDSAQRLRDVAVADDGAPRRAVQASPLVPVLVAAHRAMDSAAGRRGRTLAARAATERDAEIARADDYYAAALAAIDKRRAGADPQRQALLDARAQATIAERDRRLAEIGEKYRHRHDLRPYRLHLVDVPVWRLATDVRRGDRRWPLTFDYVPSLGTVAPIRCPACAACAPLVATKAHLGCASCVPAKTAAVPPPGVKPPASPTAGSSEKTRRSGEANTDRRPPAPTKAPKSPVTPAVKPTTTTTSRRGDRDRPVVPGKAEERKVIDFWNHVGAGENRKFGRLIAPDSPLAALTRLYGTVGPLYGIGVPLGHEPVRFTCGNYDQPVAGRRGATGGTVYTPHGEHDYLLLWSPDRLLEEIFPYSVPWHLGAASRMRNALVNQAPPARPDLDTVATLMHTRTTARHGMTFTARALAAWWRLPDPEDLVTRFTHPVIAAAVERAVRYWSGAAGVTYAEAAKAFGADEDAMRKATPALQKHLGLSSTRNW